MEEIGPPFYLLYVRNQKKKKSLNKGVATNSIKSKQTEGANTDKKEHLVI